MKNLLLPVCLIVVGLVTVNAQGIGVGLRAGLNIANQSYSASGFSVSPKSITSFVAGGYVKIMFSEKLGIQPELLYNAVGSKFSDPTNTITTKTNYLSVPIFFRYNIIPQFHLLAGPQWGILLSAKGTDNSGTQDIKDQFKALDFGGAVGAGVDFGPFNAGLRYNFGLSNILKDTSGDETVKNNVFQIVAGFKLFGK